MKMPTDKEIYEMGKTDPRVGALMLRRQKKMREAEASQTEQPKNELPPQT